MNPKRSPALARRPRTRGPFVSPDGYQYWITTLDARNRIQIPKAFFRDMDWRVGDCLAWEVICEDDHEALMVTNIDALERGAQKAPREGRTS